MKEEEVGSEIERNRIGLKSKQWTKMMRNKSLVSSMHSCVNQGSTMHGAQWPVISSSTAQYLGYRRCVQRVKFIQV